MTPKDEFMVYVPGGVSLPRLCIGYAAVERALDELGRKSARVRRVTEDELCLDVTDQFVPEDYVAPVPDDYPAGDWRPAHTRYMVNIGSFGRR